ncbi:hypothetical protein LSH36_292g02009 [Paralvinella palmiformis]|uniref:Uncharacterized protein n=1 Tax=Paralvinella palmiformis TaxID=53620 RepID=A0AAD9JI15_9ANNE|nr:hypothetical protein LSH36_292g02009 [Paralvinella palmiformis]
MDLGSPNMSYTLMDSNPLDIRSRAIGSFGVRRTTRNDVDMDSKLVASANVGYASYGGSSGFKFSQTCDARSKITNSAAVGSAMGAGHELWHSQSVRSCGGVEPMKASLSSFRCPILVDVYPDYVVNDDEDIYKDMPSLLELPVYEWRTGENSRLIDGAVVGGRGRALGDVCERRRIWGVNPRDERSPRDRHQTGTGLRRQDLLQSIIHRLFGRSVGGIRTDVVPAAVQFGGRDEMGRNNPDGRLMMGSDGRLSSTVTSSRSRMSAGVMTMLDYGDDTGLTAEESLAQQLLDSEKGEFGSCTPWFFVEGGPNWIPKLSSYIVSDSIWIRFRRDSLLLTDGSRMDQRASGREFLQLYE